MNRFIILLFGLFNLMTFAESAFTQKDKNSIVRYHNEIRAHVKPPSNAMFKLKWNEDAYENVQKFVNACVFDHNTNKERAIKSYSKGGGQNIYISTKRVFWKTAIEDWNSERKNFTFGSENNNFTDVGHYTQLVWGTTREVGCAYKKCPDFHLYACHYYPGGNIGSQINTPYRKAADGKQSCKGCIKGLVCVMKPPNLKNRLLEKCETICVDQLSNCADLKTQNKCNQFQSDCAATCNKKCQKT